MICLKILVNRVFYFILFNFINIYQKIISPILPARCRYYPTCSNYGKQALAWHGVWKGGWLLLKRLGRCQPWGGHGVDFVPIPLASYHYMPLYSALTETDAKNELNDASHRLTSSVYRDNSSYVARLNYLMR